MAPGAAAVAAPEGERPVAAPLARFSQVSVEPPPPGGAKPSSRQVRTHDSGGPAGPRPAPRAEGAIMAPRATAVAAPGGGPLVAARWPAFLRVSVEPDVFSCYENLWPGGAPRTPARHPRATRRPPDMVRPRKAEAEGMDGAAHQTRQRQARRERWRATRHAPRRWRGPSPKRRVRRSRRAVAVVGGQRGHSPPPGPLRGTRRAWPRGVGWLSRLSGQIRPPMRGTLGRQNRHVPTVKGTDSGRVNNARIGDG